MAKRVARVPKIRPTREQNLANANSDATVVRRESDVQIWQKWQVTRWLIAVRAHLEGPVNSETFLVWNASSLQIMKIVNHLGLTSQLISLRFNPSFLFKKKTKDTSHRDTQVILSKILLLLKVLPRDIGVTNGGESDQFAIQKIGMVDSNDVFGTAHIWTDCDFLDCVYRCVRGIQRKQGYS